MSAALNQPALSFLSFAFIQKKQIHFSNCIITIHLMLETKPLQDLQCDYILERISQHKNSKFSSQLYPIVVLYNQSEETFSSSVGMFEA